MDEFETYDNEMLIDYVDEDFENKQRNYFKYLEITFTLFVYFIAMDGNCLFSCFSYHLHNGNTLSLFFLKNIYPISIIYIHVGTTTTTTNTTTTKNRQR